MNLLEAIARDLRRPEEQLRLPADLLRQGYDPSYLARVRPDELNQLDAPTLSRLRRALRYRDSLEAYKQAALDAAKERGTLTEALTNAIASADSKAEVNALTKFGASRRGTKALAAASPLSEKLATEVLMHSGPTPENFRDWVKSVTGVEEEQVDTLISETKVYLQALLLEDAGLVSKIFNFIKQRAVLQSSEIVSEASGDEPSGEADGEGKPKKKKRRSRSGGKDRTANASVAPAAESANATAEDSTTTNDSVSEATTQQFDEPLAVNQSEQEQQSNEEVDSEDPSSTELPSATNEHSEDQAPVAVEVSADGVSSESVATEASAAEEAPIIPGFQTPTKKTRAVSAKELSPRQRRRRWLKFQLEPYYKLRRSLLKLSPFQIVMLGRGNRSQILKVDLDYDRKAVGRMARESLFPKDHPMSSFLNEAVDEAVSGALTSRIEQEVLGSAEEHAQQELIEYAVEHLQALLMQRPLRNHRIMMIDAIGTKSAAVVIVDPEGRIDFVADLPCNSSRPDAVNQNVKLLGEWAHTYNVSVLAVSTGPARRFVLPSIREFMSQCDPSTIRWTMVDRDGADTYCTTRIALQELPSLSRRHRAAAWLAWRLQDPLVQLLKVDPTRLRLAVFQAELPQDLIEESLQEAVAASIAMRGIDYWNGHPEAMKCVPGLNEQTARIICEVRDSEAPATREALSNALLDKIPANSLRQSIGFLRVFESQEPLDGTLIHPDDYRLAQRLINNTELQAPPAAPPGWVRQKLADVPDVSDSAAVELVASEAPKSFAEGLDEPASPVDDASSNEVVEVSAEESSVSSSVSADDASAASDESDSSVEVQANATSDEVHSVGTDQEPASGAAVAQNGSGPVKTFGGHELLTIKPDFTETQPVAEAAKVDAEKLARMWQVGREKLKFVAYVLQHPFDDPRDLSISIPLMKRVPKIEELEVGSSLWALVSGIADFGVFADLGPDCSGLIHVSRLSKNYVEDPRQVVNVGDLIQVWVQEVDATKRRISLSALPPGVTQQNRFAADHSDQRSDRGDRSHSGRGQGRGPHPAKGGHQGKPSGDSRGNARGEGQRTSDRSRSSDSKPFGQRDGASQGNQGAGQRQGGRPSGDRGNRSYGGDRRDNRGRGKGRHAPDYGNATVVDLPSKELPKNVRKGNASESETPATGKEPMRSFSDLLARFQTKHDEAKQPPTQE